MSTIAIIGGGIAGTALAYQLRDSDYDVRLFEKEALGAGTTGKSIACFAWHLNYEGLDHDIASRSWDIYQSLIADGELSYHENGFMKLAETESFFNQLRESVKELQDAGVPAKVLDESEITEHNVSPEAASAGATFYPSIGRLDPGEIVSYFAEMAREGGVDIETGVTVTDVITDDGAVTGLETSDGTLDADMVVNAAGPWARVLNEKAGVSVPLKHTMAPISVLESDEKFELPTVILESGVYFTGERSAKTLVGNAPHESGDEGLWETALELDSPGREQGMGVGSVRESHRNLIAETAPRAIPKLAGAEVSNEWRGLRCVTPDHRPFVGPTELEGFYALTGMSGEGITLSPACAEILAKHLITDETTDVLEYLSPQRSLDGHRPKTSTVE